MAQREGAKTDRQTEAAAAGVVGAENSLATHTMGRWNYTSVFFSQGNQGLEESKKQGQGTVRAPFRVRSTAAMSSEPTPSSPCGFLGKSDFGRTCGPSSRHNI